MLFEKEQDHRSKLEIFCGLLKLFWLFKFSGTVDNAQQDSSTLAFWMANSSELLHFLKSDRHITAFSLRAQDILAETVHNAFKFLVTYFQNELEMNMPTILSESEDDEQATLGIMKVNQFLIQCDRSRKPFVQFPKMNMIPLVEGTLNRDYRP